MKRQLLVGLLVVAFGLVCAVVVAREATAASAAVASSPATSSAGSATLPVSGRLTMAAIQQAEFSATGGATENFFGGSVAVVGDTALVGASGEPYKGKAWAGAAYVFVRSGTHWVQKAKLTVADEGQRDYFGQTVALSSDGTTAVIGASGKTVGGKTNAGAAYVFVRSGTTWSLQGKLLPTTSTAYQSFGCAVAVAGNTVLVGANWETVGGHADAGAAYVFTRASGHWTQRKRLTANNAAAADYFGCAVALSGTSALIGAREKTIGGMIEAGAAYVYTGSGASWTQQFELTAGDGLAKDLFGCSVALSGSTALVGAENKGLNGHQYVGAAYIFTRSGSTWSQQQKLTASDATDNDYFGLSVALSGSTALIGANGKTVNTDAEAGAAYDFTRSSGVWSQQSELTALDAAAGGVFGDSVALNGSRALVGSPADPVVVVKPGAAYVFLVPAVPANTKAPLISGIPAAGQKLTCLAGFWTANPAATFTFQWLRAGVAISGATGKTYIVRTIDRGKKLWCRVTAHNSLGSASVLSNSRNVWRVPRLGALSPTRGRAGSTVTITGADFGVRHGTGVVYFGKLAVTRYLSWSSAKIKVILPAIAKGRVAVKVRTIGGTSNVRYFTRT